MATTISTQDLIDVKRDIEDIGKAVNEKVIVSPRYGEDFKSLPMITEEFQDAINTIVIDAGVPALAVSDASGKTQQEINNEYERRFKTVADPRNFGAPNNGVDDDAQGVREAVAYLDSIGGGELYMRSNVPWKFLTLSSNNQDAVVIKSRILVNFGDFSSTTQAGTEMRSVFKIVEDGGTYHAFCGWQGGLIQGANLAEYGLYSDPNSYTPYMSVKGIQLRGFTEAAASLNPYMSSFEMSHFSFSKRGLVLNNSGTTMEITSTNISNCYANGCEEVGFKVANRMLYSSLQNCGVDACNGIAYDLDMQSGSIINCGAERVVQLARFPNVNDGIIINGLLGVGIGSLDPDAPADAAIEFSGSGVVMNSVSGVRILTHPTPRYRNKDLVVNVSSGKNPRVNILDNSILRQNTQVNVAAGVTPPDDESIKFNISAFRRTQVETLTPSELKSRLDIYNKNSLEFTHTIQLSAGSEDLEKVIKNITGEGTFIIQGNTSNRELVKLRGARLGMIIRNCTAKIIFRAVTFENNTGYGDLSLAQVTISNCREVIFDNVGFDSTKHTVGTAILAQGDSRVFLRNGTSAGVGHAVNTVWQEQSGATITIEPMPSPPSTGLWMIGQRVKNSDIGTGNIIEWVYVRNSENTANEWRPITV